MARDFVLLSPCVTGVFLLLGALTPLRSCFYLICTRNTLFTSVMSSKYCSSCTQKRLLSCFLLDPSNPASKEFKTCASCRASDAKSKKRKALQPLDPNVPAKKRRPVQPAKTLTRPEPPPP
jgi:hypothetical protein